MYSTVQITTCLAASCLLCASGLTGPMDTHQSRTRTDNHLINIGQHKVAFGDEATSPNIQANSSDRRSDGSLSMVGW